MWVASWECAVCIFWHRLLTSLKWQRIRNEIGLCKPESACSLSQVKSHYFNFLSSFLFFFFFFKQKRTASHYSGLVSLKTKCLRLQTKIIQEQNFRCRESDTIPWVIWNHSVWSDIQSVVLRPAFGITCELVRTANTWAPTWTQWIRISGGGTQETTF